MVDPRHAVYAALVGIVLSGCGPAEEDVTSSQQYSAEVISIPDYSELDDASIFLWLKHVKSVAVKDTAVRNSLPLNQIATALTSPGPLSRPTVSASITKLLSGGALVAPQLNEARSVAAIVEDRVARLPPDDRARMVESATGLSGFQRQVPERFRSADVHARAALSLLGRRTPAVSDDEIRAAITKITDAIGEGADLQSRAVRAHIELDRGLAGLRPCSVRASTTAGSLAANTPIEITWNTRSALTGCSYSLDGKNGGLIDCSGKAAIHASNLGEGGHLIGLVGPSGRTMCVSPFLTITP